MELRGSRLQSAIVVITQEGLEAQQTVLIGAWVCWDGVGGTPAHAELGQAGSMLSRSCSLCARVMD